MHSQQSSHRSSVAYSFLSSCRHCTSLTSKREAVLCMTTNLRAHPHSSQNRVSPSLKVATHSYTQSLKCQLALDNGIRRAVAASKNDGISMVLLRNGYYSGGHALPLSSHHELNANTSCVCNVASWPSTHSSIETKRPYDLWHWRRNKSKFDNFSFRCREAVSGPWRCEQQTDSVHGQADNGQM